jgi:hypothetical protein
LLRFRRSSEIFTVSEVEWQYSSIVFHEGLKNFKIKMNGGNVLNGEAVKNVIALLK